MRPKYYLKLFGQMNHKKSFVLFCIILVIILVSSIYLIKKFIPIIEVTCESAAKAVGVKVTEETVNELIKDVDYNELMNISTNNDGKITSISANVVELNKIAANIAYMIQEKLNNMGKITVRLPIGELIGLNIFSGYGPDIDIKLMPLGNIETKFNSQFVSKGINQTKHTINMNVKSIITIVAPFIGTTVVCEREITIAETVIVGDIPTTYYNIEGIEEANKKGALEMMGE